MNAAERQAHWESVYTTKGEKEVSWFQETPAPSLELLALIGATARSAVIDVGGGASRLVDSLVARGYEDITVLDLSQAALAAANRRYQTAFGFIYIVCASGKTPEEILNNLQQRLGNDRETELRVAAGEQRKITRLRLEKLIAS